MVTFATSLQARADVAPHLPPVQPSAALLSDSANLSVSIIIIIVIVINIIMSSGPQQQIPGQAEEDQ